MDRDTVIKLAHETECLDEGHYGSLWMERFERFAAMVAAAERGRIAAEFDRRAVYADGTPSSGWYEPHEPAEIVRGMK